MARRTVSVDPTFPVRLRELRAERGMSLRDLGTISRSCVHDLETGRKSPTPAIAAALDSALGAGGALARLVTVDQATSGPAAAVSDEADEIEALELSRRMAARLRCSFGYADI